MLHKIHICTEENDQIQQQTIIEWLRAILRQATYLAKFSFYLYQIDNFKLYLLV